MEFSGFAFPIVETVVSGMAAFLLGLLWYHPKVLGKKWVEARGKGLGEMHPTPLPIVVSFMLWMMAAFFFSFFVVAMDIHSAPGLISLACLLWVAFAMPPTIMGAFYTGYPLNAVAIDSAYQLGGYYLFAVTHIVMADLLKAAA